MADDTIPKRAAPDPPRLRFKDGRWEVSVGAGWVDLGGKSWRVVHEGGLAQVIDGFGVTVTQLPASRLPPGVVDAAGAARAMAAELNRGPLPHFMASILNVLCSAGSVSVADLPTFEPSLPWHSSVRGGGPVGDEERVVVLDVQRNEILEITQPAGPGGRRERELFATYITNAANSFPVVARRVGKPAPPTDIHQLLIDLSAGLAGSDRLLQKERKALSRAHEGTEYALKERDEARSRVAAVEAAAEDRDGTWMWSTSDDNHLESLVDGAAVTMTAGVLRAMLAEAEAKAAPPEAPEEPAFRLREAVIEVSIPAAKTMGPRLARIRSLLRLRHGVDCPEDNRNLGNLGDMLDAIIAILEATETHFTLSGDPA